MNELKEVIRQASLEYEQATDDVDKRLAYRILLQAVLSDIIFTHLHQTRIPRQVG